MSPTRGVLSFHESYMYEDQYSIFDIVPPPKVTADLAADGDTFFWCMHYVGILCGFLLLLGVMPRWNLLGVYITTVSFHHFTDLPLDMQDHMFRIWTWWFLFLPLHHVTIYDVFQCGQSDNGRIKPSPTPDQLAEDTWPIWPYRLIQLQVIFIYMGAAWGKLLLSNSWTSGLEIW
jgi:hypothetical protein